jgi:hypothetical protein
VRHVLVSLQESPLDRFFTVDAEQNALSPAPVSTTTRTSSFVRSDVHRLFNSNCIVELGVAGAG